MLRVEQALCRHLTVAVEDTLELLIEVLDGQRAQLVEDPARFDPIVGVRIGAVLRSPLLGPDLAQWASVSIEVCGTTPLSWSFLCQTPPLANRIVLSTATARPYAAQG